MLSVSAQHRSDVMKVTYHSVAAFIAWKWRASGKAAREDTMNIIIHSGFRASTTSFVYVYIHEHGHGQFHGMRGMN